jgi:hypothetical protein
MLYALLRVLGEAFEEEYSYGAAPPSRGCTKRLLAGDYSGALVASAGAISHAA